MAHPIKTAALGIVEKVILGATPDHTVAIAPAPGAESARQTARLASVRKYLESQPAFRVELERQITQAWQAAGGEREKFQSAIAEHRARILSLATVSAFPPQSQKVAADFERELTRYLVERQGASGDGVIV